MDITRNDVNGVAIITVNGRMDATTVSVFNDASQGLIKENATKIVVNLSGLEYISSAGLRGILSMGKDCKKAGANLAFCSMQSMVADMFKLSGFMTILHVFATQDDALANV